MIAFTVLGMSMNPIIGIVHDALFTL